ncbi:MAG: Integrase core domain protein [Spirochaetes bacterium ADurb.Bin110]|nr:MAG: Integrase core domain protein [Spirochaetes bacterium ADurb.Bin110]
MLEMNQVDQIKELQREGYGPVEIAKRLRVDRKTVAHYMKKEDFNRSLEVAKGKQSKLDRFKPKIDEWLREDRQMRYRERHTAKRIHERLKKEYPEEYQCSYALVQRYVKQCKEAKEQSKGYLELLWAKAEAQADFGEAEILIGGIRKTIKYLTLSFPYSNAGFSQCFGGERAECVCQGLMNIFAYIGGVPLRIVVDNGTGIGRRIQGKVSYSELFLRFKCHYGFSVSFCNVNAGHEKGNVENKIGYTRRNFFVPMPEVESLDEFNKELFMRAEEDHEREHYKKGLSISELFAEDKKALGSLPVHPFNVERFERVSTDGYWKFCVDGKHWYSSAPEYGNSPLIVGLKAHELVVYRPDGNVLCTHLRVYGEERTDSADYRTSLATLLRKPGAWPNSAFRSQVSEDVRSSLDGLSKPELKTVLQVLTESSERFGFEVAMSSLEEAIRCRRLDRYSLGVVAARVAFEELGEPCALGPDLGYYDRAFIEERGSGP